MNNVTKYTFGVPEKFTPVKIMKPSFENINIAESGDTSPIKLSDAEFETTSRGCVLKLPMCQDESIYGFGLQLKSFRQNGRKKTIRTNADPVSDSGDSHAPVPFYVSTKGYGVYIDSSRYISFYTGGSAKKSDGSRQMIIEIPSAEGVDIYIFTGDNISEVVAAYNMFSGGGSLPNLWGLGVIYRAWGQADEQLVLKQAKMLRDNGIPCDCLGLEPGWHTHAYSCSYTFSDKFPNYEKMIGELKANHFKLNLWEHAYVHPSAPIYDEMKDYSADYLVWGGLVPDFTLKGASEPFKNLHKELIRKGVTSFKLDECDSSDYTGSWSFPNSAKFPSGIDGEQMHNELGLLYQRVQTEVFSENNMRTFGQVRASHALSAPYPYALYSDLYNHTDYMRAMANAGFCGLLWTPEVRMADSAEELIRRLQSVVLSPQALINCWQIPNFPWLQYEHDKNIKGEFLPDDTTAYLTSQVKKILNLRMSLIPYLYSAYMDYCMTGKPPFRALVSDYSDDTATYDIFNEYLIGNSILAAPVIFGEKTKRVYLPKGDWYDFFTGEKHSGGSYIEIDTSNLDTIPVYVRENSIIPLAKPLEYITENTVFELTPKSFGENPESFILYEDDGLTLNFRKGEINEVTLLIENGEYLLKRRGDYPKTVYTLEP